MYFISQDFFAGHLITDTNILSKILSINRQLLTSSLQKPTVEDLATLANIQCCISQSLECLLAHNTTHQNRALETSLKNFLYSSASSGNAQPG